MDLERLPAFVDPFGCQDPLRAQYGDQPLCCMSDTAESREPQIHQPCLVCAVRPATVVEVPCGHVTVCLDCYGDYQTNVRCLRCRDVVSARVDIGPFLDQFGRPASCNMCKSSLAAVVTLPCVHMYLCAHCLPVTPAGCPSCGANVDQSCTVKWFAGENSARPSARSGATAVGDMARLPSLALGTLTPRTAGSGTRDGLSKATEDVDQEILRLERELRQLRTLSQATPQATPPGTASANPQDAGLLGSPAAPRRMAKPPSRRPS
eukprot:CAMPEP_0115574798 /NCGR_PEP_ID=MMETSP0272-20121206/1709_1 /TAXON_ID=71861 /ORGANISM="Scrippsiella trochoidea, Strain CCMP3099" /LENGTH=263 /DNA_ID=CAMNT_0003009523 /DNA_START=82 /DNA_END=871 /DNA_ORIENTATION=+